MKVYISDVQDGIPDDSFKFINSIEMFKTLIDDGELEEVVVNDFLSKFSYIDVGGVVNTILSKVKIDGSVTFYQTDVEILAYELTRGYINIEQFNDALLSKPVSCFLTVNILKSLLRNARFNIKKVSIEENGLFIISGERNV